MSLINYGKKLLSFNNYLINYQRLKFYNLNLGIFKRLYVQKTYFYRYSSTNIISEQDKRSLDPVTYLSLNVQEQQRIYKNDLISALKDIENKGLQENDGLFLLQCCGNKIPDIIPSERLSLAHQVWAILKSNNTKFDVNYYNSFLQCYIDNKMKLSYKNFLDHMSCEPNEETYHLLLKCVCEHGDINQAVDIVNIMKKKGLPANEPVFSALIYGYLKTGDSSNVKNIVSTMKIAHLTPSSLTYTELLRGYAELKDNSNFMNTLKETIENSNLSLENILSIVQSICSTEKTDLLYLLKKHYSVIVSSKQFQNNVTDLCIHLIYLKKAELAYEVYKSLIDPEIGFLTESDTYCSSLLYEMTKAGTEPNVVIKICDDLIKNKRNEYAIYKTLECSLRILNTNLAISLLRHLHTKNINLKNHYFWPLLIHAGQTTSKSGIFEILNIMTELGVQLENNTLEFYSLKFITNIDPENVIYKLKEMNMKIVDILTPLSAVLLRQNRISDTADIVRKYKVKLDGDSLVKPLTFSYISNNNTKSAVDILKYLHGSKTLTEFCGQMIILLLNKSSTTAQYQQIVNLLQAFNKNNLKISSIHLDKIEFLTTKLQDNDIKSKILRLTNSLIDYSYLNDNNYIPHPRDMNLEQLECHLIELTNKKMETRGVLRKLIQMHCRIGNFERVQELLTEFKGMDYKISVGMKAGLLDLYIKSKNLELAQKIYKEIVENDPTFIVDEFKIIDLAALLVMGNNFEEAVKLIKTEIQKRKIRGGKTIEPNCWRLLNASANLKDYNNTKLLFELLTNSGFCVPNNVILGPLIRVHLNSGNLKGAVEEYEKFCNKYKETPLQYELLCKLVEKENSVDCLQKVIDATGHVRGLKSAKMALAAALSETNKSKTLRELLMEHSTDIATALLEQHCNRWIKENNVAPLKTLLTSRGCFSQVNQAVIYESMMKIYNANDELEEALTLWNELQNIDFACTENLKNILRTILNNHNHILAAKV